MSDRRPAPPKHLGHAGRRLWRGVLSDYDVGATHDLARLQVAAECADRLDEARRVIDRDGPYVPDRYGSLKGHPALAVEKDSRALMLRAIRELGVDLVESQPSRPPSRWRGK